MAKMLFATLLTLFVLTTSSSPCHLSCPTHLDLEVQDKCVVGVPDLEHTVTYSTDCHFVSQSMKGGFLPIGDHSVRVTVRNTHTHEDEVCDILVKSRDTTSPIVLSSRMTPSAFFGSGKMMYSSLKMRYDEKCCSAKCYPTSVTIEDHGVYVPEGKTCEEAGAALGLTCSCRQSCAGNPCNAGQGLGFGGGKYCGTNVCCCGTGCSKSQEQDEPIQTTETCLDLPMDKQFKMREHSRDLKICDGKNDEHNDRTYHITGKCVDGSDNESEEFTTKIVITSPPTGNSDPTCAHGIFSPKTGACCMSTCKDIHGNPQCGGTGCSLLPGGTDGCCTGVIVETNKSCTDNVAPCVV
jgi:hypothetical protein